MAEFEILNPLLLSMRVNKIKKWTKKVESQILLSCTAIKKYIFKK